MNSTTMNLDRATKEGVIREDVKDFAAGGRITTGLATYRAIVRCSCGTPVPLHIETFWRGGEPTMLLASISAESCPDCGGSLMPSTVAYAGIYSLGWPFMPATTYSSADLYHAIALMEVKRRDAEKTNPSSTNSLRRKREADSEVSTGTKQPGSPPPADGPVLPFCEAKVYSISH